MFSVVSLLAYVISFFVSAARFKEDAAFHRMVYLVCFIAIGIMFLFTFLRIY